MTGNLQEPSFEQILLETLANRIMWHTSLPHGSSEHSSFSDLLVKYLSVHAILHHTHVVVLGAAILSVSYREHVTEQATHALLAKFVC